VMAEMLAAGSLPKGVDPWPGFKPVDTEALFGDLGVYKRWKAGEPQIKQLMEEAHFVIMLPLGGAQTGTKLEQRIIERLATIAGSAFGPELEAKVRSSSVPESALEALVAAVPEQVPIAILVDEYDQAIINDVANKEWLAAKRGITALRSLMMATKAQGLDRRIKRFVVTGVARFAHTSLFSGANNFEDLTAHPMVSRMMGFTEEEIRSSFPSQLARLGQHERPSARAPVSGGRGCFPGGRQD